MRWLVYGDLMERHVTDSFVSALSEAGHDVERIASVTRSHVLEGDDVRAEAERRITAAGPADVLFVIRAADVDPGAVLRCRDRGMRTIVWFPDDPLLYQTVSRHVVEAYDLTLHSAREDVLRFYEERHGVRGWSFPFWTDDAHYPRTWVLDAADVEVGFLGNAMGPHRVGRYEMLAALPYRVRYFGKPPAKREDYAQIHGGTLEQDDIPRGLVRFRTAVNVAQSFDLDPSNRFFFPELPRFGTFFFPSRLIAYAACGVPSVTLEPAGVASPLASVPAVGSVTELSDLLGELLGDEDRLRRMSAAIRSEFEATLTAGARVRFLERLLERSGASQDVPDADLRATAWRAGAGSAEAPVARALEIPAQIEPPPVPRAPIALVISADPATPHARALVRGGREAGARVLHAVVAAGADAWRVADGRPVIDERVVTRVRDRSTPDLLLADEATGIGAVRAVASVPPAVASTPGVPATVASVRVSVVGDDVACAVLRDRVRSLGADVVVDGAADIVLLASASKDAAVVAAEALGSGAIVVAHVDAAIGDLPALRARDAAHALGLVGMLLARPDEAAMLRRRHAVLASRDSWAHRWGGLLAQAPATGARPIGVRQIVAIAGYFGRDNAGDELILRAEADRIPAVATAVAYGPERVSVTHGLPAAWVGDLGDEQRMLAVADLLVLGGGGIIHDLGFPEDATVEQLLAKRTRGIPAFARWQSNARARGLPTALFCVGVGPLRTDAGRAIAAQLARDADLVSVRDEASRAELAACGFDGDVMLGADPTLLLPSIERPDEPSDHITIAIRQLPDGPADLAARIARTADAVVERTGSRIVFVPFQRGRGILSDVAAGEAVLREMKRGDAAQMLVPADLDELRATLAGARAGLAMRLHASVLANAAGVPTVGLAYDDKVSAHYRELGRPHLAFPLDADPVEVAAAVEEVMSDPAGERAALGAAIEPMRARAEAALARTIELLHGARR